MRVMRLCGGIALVPAVTLLVSASTGQAQENRGDSDGQIEERAAPAQDVTFGGEVSYSQRPSVALDGEPGEEVGVSVVQAAASVRIQLGARTFLTPGVSFQAQQLSREGNAMSGAAGDLYSLEVPVMLVHVLNEKWALAGRMSAGLSGDFATLDRHLGVTGAAMATRRMSDRLSLGFGGGVSYGAGRWLPVPMATIDWRPTDRLRVDAFLPLYARGIHRFGDRLEAGVALFGEGARWALDGDRGDARTLDYYSLDAGGVLGMRVGERTWLNLFAGWNAFRRYEVHGGDGDGHHDPERGLVLRGGLEIRLPGS